MVAARRYVIVVIFVIAAIVTPPDPGSQIVLAAWRTLYFKPASNWNGSTSFTYSATDNQGGVSASSATASITVTAVNPGSWSNGLRIGIMPTLSGGFDMSIAEYRGTERVRGELFRNLNVIPNDPNNVVTVIARQSELVRVSGTMILPAGMPQSWMR